MRTLGDTSCEVKAEGLVEKLSLQTLGVVLGHVQFKELVENLAKKLEKEEASSTN